jgi:hypothetical protein
VYVNNNTTSSRLVSKTLATLDCKTRLTHILSSSFLNDKLCSIPVAILVDTAFTLWNFSTNLPSSHSCLKAADTLSAKPESFWVHSCLVEQMTLIPSRPKCAFVAKPCWTKNVNKRWLSARGPLSDRARRGEVPDYAMWCEGWTVAYNLDGKSNTTPDGADEEAARA